MLVWFYCLDWQIALSYTFAFILAVAMLRFSLKRYDISNKVTKFFKMFLFSISLFLVFYATLWNRSTEDGRVILAPFQSLIDAQTQPEMYRTLLMNLILFVPFGAGLSNIISDRFSIVLKMLMTFLSAIIISVFIETIQYIFTLGIFQTDDIIFNSFGALLGSLILIIHKFINSYCIRSYKFHS